MADLSPLSRFTDDVFFSTTDSRGIIRQVNDAFVRFSRHGREELIGAPCDVVRHPATPGGLVRTMDQTLRAGDPFAGYVRNRGRGDSAYDTLATVTPLPGGGYLSVEIPPLTRYFDAARDIYHGMNDLERRRLDEELAERGFGSYGRWQWEILPAEVEERELRGAGLPAGDGVALPEIRGLYAELDGFMAALQGIGDATAALDRAGRRLEEETDAPARVGAQMDRLAVSGPERTLLLAPLQAWLTMHGVVTEHIAELTGLLGGLRRAGSRTRFHIALVRLHAVMAADLATEDPTGAALPPLIDALRADVTDLAAQVAEHRRLSANVNAKVRSVTSLMDVPRDVIGGWLEDTTFGSYPPDAQRLVAEVRSAAEGASASIAELEDLTVRLGGETEHRPEGLRAHVERVAQAAADCLG